MLESYHLLLVDDDPNQVELTRHFFFKQSPERDILPGWPERPSQSSPELSPCSTLMMQ